MSSRPTQYFAEGEVGHISGFEGWLHDLELAEQLFAEGGSPSISADYLATFFNETQITVYAEQMGELGIQMSVQTVPPPQFFSAWNTGEFPVGTGSQDELHPYDWYLSWYAADAPNNPSGWEPDELKAPPIARSLRVARPRPTSSGPTRSQSSRIRRCRAVAWSARRSLLGAPSA
jgi:peptide/nickel transport system substrate-binding protein